MLPSELIAQVRKLEIRTGRMVSELFAGRYQSVFKGLGVEFSEVREYCPGDDVRSIDWNVTARTGHPFVKRFVEERELTVLIACDLSGSLGFGSRARLKRALAAEVAALLALAALRNNDKVGLAVLTDDVEWFVPPRKGRLHALRLIRDLLAFQPRGSGTALGRCLERLNKTVRRRAILFLISDFQDEGFEHALRVSAKRHDLVPLWVQDPREAALPAAPALIDLVDPESGRRRPVDLSRDDVRSRFARAAAQRRRRVETTFKSAGLEWVPLQTDEPYAASLIRFFQKRAKRFR